MHRRRSVSLIGYPLSHYRGVVEESSQGGRFYQFSFNDRDREWVEVNQWDGSELTGEQQAQLLNAQKMRNEARVSRNIVADFFDHDVKIEDRLKSSFPNVEIEVPKAPNYELEVVGDLGHTGGLA